MPRTETRMKIPRWIHDMCVGLVGFKPGEAIPLSELCVTKRGDGLDLWRTLTVPGLFQELTELMDAIEAIGLGMYLPSLLKLLGKGPGELPAAATPWQIAQLFPTDQIVELLQEISHQVWLREVEARKYHPVAQDALQDLLGTALTAEFHWAELAKLRPQDDRVVSYLVVPVEGAQSDVEAAEQRIRRYVESLRGSPVASDDTLSC